MCRIQLKIEKKTNAGLRDSLSLFHFMWTSHSLVLFLLFYVMACPNIMKLLKTKNYAGSCYLLTVINLWAQEHKTQRNVGPKDMLMTGR